MGIDIEEFEGYLKIDKSELDEELIQQPTLFYKVAHELELAISERDKAKLHADTIGAQVDGELRDEFEESGDKYTEAQIKNLILQDEEYQAAQEHYSEKRKAVGVLTVLKESFSQRSYMLRDMVSLAVANYYERESINAGERKGKDVKYDKTKERMKEKRNRRRVRNSDE